MKLRRSKCCQETIYQIVETLSARTDRFIARCGSCGLFNGRHATRAAAIASLDHLMVAPHERKAKRHAKKAK